MHIRNPYRTPPDFLQLAEAYPLLKPFVYENKNGAPSINFKDPAAQRYLTEALLRRDFGMHVEIPSDRLCPAVPNRLNYIVWIQDILTASPPPSTRNGAVLGIDVGTGASVIYPLLACSLSPSWTFYATDVDSVSLAAAEKNIGFNNLQSRIMLVQVDPSETILQRVFDEQNVNECDFVMCNPPFYTSKEEIVKAKEDKEFDPNAVCTGADVEMITAGGEAGFVCRMVNESVTLGTRCRWYTSLLGKHSSIVSVVELFRSLKIDNYGITEFVQGQTRRWGIVWSFGDDRLPDALVRETSDSLHPLLPLPNNLRQPLPNHENFTVRTTVSLVGKYSLILEGVGWSIVSDDLKSKELVLKLWAKENTWSRKARRQLVKSYKERRGEDKIITERGTEAEANVVLLVRCFHSQGNGRGIKILEAIWVRGKERELFESLWSHLSRRVLERLQ